MGTEGLSAGPTIVPVIVGPTASGKTAMSLLVARSVGNVEIVSADSRQVYIGMDIGTAKPSESERREIPHHLIDIIPPSERYSAGRFASDARAVIDEIVARGRLPLVVGGSGFYIRALFEGLSAPAADPAVYRELERRGEVEGYDRLYEELQRLDPTAAAAHSPNNREKTLRALACIVATGQPYSSFATEEAIPAWDRRPAYFGIAPSRPELYARIDRRVEEMVESGLIEETRGLLEGGYNASDPGMRTVGYREALDYLSGECDIESMIARIQQSTRRYAKRQTTWFRRVEGVRWSERPAPDPLIDLIGRIRGPSAASD